MLPNGVFDIGRYGLLHIHTRDKRSQDGLFCDDVWPGSVVLSNYLLTNINLIRDMVVLELGAGASLPSFVCSKLGAKLNVITDYPGESVIENIRILKDRNFTSEENGKIVIQEHIWGENTIVLRALDGSDGEAGFDVILLAELFWKQTSHLYKQLLDSCVDCLGNEGIILVSFAHRDAAEYTYETVMQFFELAERCFSLKTTWIQDTVVRDVDDCDDVCVKLAIMRRS